MRLEEMEEIGEAVFIESKTKEDNIGEVGNVASDSRSRLPQSLSRPSRGR